MASMGSVRSVVYPTGYPMGNPMVVSHIVYPAHTDRQPYATIAGCATKPRSIHSHVCPNLQTNVSFTPTLAMTTGAALSLHYLYNGRTRTVSVFNLMLAGITIVDAQLLTAQLTNRILRKVIRQ